ncbi:MAG: hypothetical protein AVDCRST_MAG39-1581 [uncultured Sphingomonadaceae bacterium]|uniref:Glycine transporter domain-containing protein n=1 Tax=uncultured Sphingomonadaceae bacterium TaxID=169976 RepID=A0A6J4SU54_9SPHN|nr:MAG: hypothetical protein AVDCRST_MAG39-1581 [uncultured Sphingomonadaceae bacterium]
MSDRLLSAWSLFDLAAIFVFALTGALTAAAHRQTLVTFAFFALVTGVGGGTARDLLIGAPVFWLRQNAALAVCLLAALAVWVGPRGWWRGRLLDWLDALGLAAYATFGAVKGLAFGVAPLPAVAMGVLTACLGGIVRDVLAGQPSILMRPELYVTAAALAAGLAVGLILLGLPPIVAGPLGAAAGFSLRALAIARGLRLPAYRAREA